jgi:hypothetical protein
MTENINLEAEDIMGDFNDGDHDENEDEEEEEEVVGAQLPQSVEIKGPEFYQKLNKLKEYIKVFPDECRDISMKNSQNFSFELVNNKLEEAKFAVANRKGAGKTHRLLFKGGLSVLEMEIAPMVGMDLAGFTNTAITDDDLMKTLDELALENDWGMQTLKPEQRLILGLGMIAYKIDAHNKAAKKIESRAPENKANYDDL